MKYLKRKKILIMLIMINNYTKLKCVKSTKNNNDKHLKIIKKNYILYFNLVDIYKILINLIFILLKKYFNIFYVLMFLPLL